VLILGDLQGRLLILLDLKSFIISDLIKNDEFAEVLILEGLGGAMGMGGWNFRPRDPPSASASGKATADTLGTRISESRGVPRLALLARDSHP
jgi:hypothetical protein